MATRRTTKKNLPATIGSRTHPGLPYFTLDKDLESLLDLSPSQLKRVHVSVRTRLAVKLRLAGADWDQIANKLGWNNADRAMMAVQRVIDRLYKIDPTELEDVRGLELARLDAMQLVFWEKATRMGDEKAAGVVLKIMEMRQRLMGVTTDKQASASIEFSGNNPKVLVIGGTEREYINQMRQLAGEDPLPLEEGDAAG